MAHRFIMTKFLKTAIEIFLFLIFLSLSCDYGYENGSDLVDGEWTELYSNSDHRFEFYNDDTGYEIERSSTAGSLVYRYYLEYEVISSGNSNNYKTLKLIKYDIDEKGDIPDFENDYEGKEKYQYYFSLDKKYLYMKKEGETFFSTYERR